MGWDLATYTEFAIKRQALSLWDLAHFIKHRALLSGVLLGREASALDFGAGPAVLSRFFAVLAGTRVTAALQGSFSGYLNSLPPLPPEFPSGDISVALADDLIRSPMQGGYDLIFSYACFHEFLQQSTLLKRLRELLNPAGQCLIIDTLGDDQKQIESLVSSSELPDDEKENILDTFRNSLSMDELQALAAETGFPIKIEPLEIPEEVFLDSQLSWPLDDTGINLTVENTQWPLGFCLSFSRS